MEFGGTVLPMKTFQYFAAGHAILAGATPDVAEILTDGVNARLVPPDDLNAFVAALRALAGDAALRQRLAEAARAGALANSWDARATRIRDFIAGRLAAMA
jgi:glycosyltransferase involved in cell wall biosynthesis